jgi:hypothetical protein
LYPTFYFPFIIGYFIFIYLLQARKQQQQVEKKAGREMEKILEKLEERKSRNKGVAKREPRSQARNRTTKGKM